MADSFELEVATPERLLLQEQVRDAQIPAEGGMIGVLPDHAALLSLLGSGPLSYHVTAGAEQSMFISGGWVQVLNNHVRVLADRAEPAGEIDVPRAETALRQAQERLSKPGIEAGEVDDALGAMRRAEGRIATAKGRPA